MKPSKWLRITRNDWRQFLTWCRRYWFELVIVAIWTYIAVWRSEAYVKPFFG